MALIYIPYEVADDELAAFLVQQAVQPVPTQPPAQQQQDPWANPATQAESPVEPDQPDSTPTESAATPTGQVVCAHGPMRYVPAGFSKSSGKAYPAFYGCSAPRGAVQCKSTPA